MRLKWLADALTWLRLALGPGLVMLGATRGTASLNVAAGMVLVGWAADASDGALARRDPEGRQTWIGENDLLVDVAFSLGLWLYLAICGWVQPVAAMIYLALALFALWQTRSEQLAWGVQGPPYIAIALVTLKTLPRIGWLFVLYLVGIVTVTWPRIPRRAAVFARALVKGFSQGQTDETETDEGS